MPERINTVLPARNAFFRGAPMLDEEQASADFQHTSHLFQREANVRNAAGCPCHYHSIQTAVRQRDTLGGAFDETDWIVEVLSVGLSPPQQPGRRDRVRRFPGHSSDRKDNRKSDERSDNWPR